MGLKLIFYVYLSWAVNVLVHEVAHYLVACILHFDILGIEIGAKLMSTSFGKLRISPILHKGSTIVNATFKSRFSAAFFYLSGAIGNLLILFVATCTTSSSFRITLQIIAVMHILSSLIPLPGSDLSNLIKVIKSNT